MLVVGLCGAVAGAYIMVDIPAPHPEAVAQSTVFLDVHGDYLGRRGPVDRQDVPLSQVPRHVQDAVIAAENRSFRTDSGIAPTAIARALWAAVTGGARQGGSTITQQYIKNALLSPERSLSRKTKEILIAVKLDRTRSKNEILQGYLNTVYFGRGAAGIQAAARNYFGADADRVSLEQGAALAAIINLPSYYERAGSDPNVTATLQHRWAWVLDGMARVGAITSSQRARAVFPAFRFYPPGRTEGQRQYLLDAAAAEAADRLHTSPDELARGGYTVHTTFDITLQDQATQSIRAQTDIIGRTHRKPGKARLHTAIAAIVPGDGAIRLLYGGGDYARQPFNDALHGAIETGTALDPLRTAQLKPPLDQLQQDATATPLQVTAAYAALAAHGRYATPYTITKITHGVKTVYNVHPTTRPAITGARTQAAGDSLFALEDRAGGHTGGAADRTAWSTAYSPRLALSIALFAELPAAGSHPAAPARLTSLLGRRPQVAAIQIAADIRSSQAPSRW
ncbi:transglycosylase domain-containing protein [Streptomyces sp. NPDC002306]